MCRLLVLCVMALCVLSGHVLAKSVVARVSTQDGVVNIEAERLLKFAHDNPQLSIDSALEALIEFEILAARAKRSKAGLHRGVSQASREVMVRKFLKEHFEPKWSPSRLPEKLVRRSYQQNQGEFKHPQLRVADHLLVTVKNKRPADPDLDEQAARLAKKIYEDLTAKPPKTRSAFIERAARYEPEAKAIGLEVLGQDLRRFAQKGRYDPTFTGPVFAAKTAPTILQPFPTRFGHHIVRLNEIIPAKNETFEQVEVGLRQKITPEVRAMKIVELTDKLAQGLQTLSRAPGARGLANFQPLEALDVEQEQVPNK